jgi:hypothetical protein
MILGIILAVTKSYFILSADTTLQGVEQGLQREK